MIAKSIEILKRMQHKNGLFSASAMDVKTGYNRAWIRDNIYEALSLEIVDIKAALKTYHALLDILLKHEDKIDWAIKEKPEHRYQYIHARYDPETLNEIYEEWGNKQNDAVGALLFKISDLTQKGVDVLRDRHDIRIMQKLIFYLESIEYWHDMDNGMWEENEEIHASSVGACLAALKLINETEFIIDGQKRRIFVPNDIIEKGQKSLNKLLPNESITKKTDLALLSLVYPYNIVSKEQRESILKNVEEILVKERGVIRYVGDQYYNEGLGEPHWTFGFPWLAIIYKNIGDEKMFSYYLDKTHSVMNKDGELPELYYADSDVHNENCPLGWAQALHIIAMKLV